MRVDIEVETIGFTEARRVRVRDLDSGEELVVRVHAADWPAVQRELLGVWSGRHATITYVRAAVDKLSLRSVPDGEARRRAGRGRRAGRAGREGAGEAGDWDRKRAASGERDEEGGGA